MNIIQPMYAVLEFYKQFSGCKLDNMHVQSAWHFQNKRKLHVVCWCCTFL